MKKASIVLVSAVLLMSLTGCGAKSDQTNYKTQSLKHQNIGNTKMSTHQHTGTGTVTGTGTGTGTVTGSTTKQNEHYKRVVEQIRNVEGVKSSSVVVDGQHIIVGLNVENQQQKAQIEKKIHKMLQDENAGYNIHITSEGALHDRIRTIEQQMQSYDGQPIRSMTNDIRVLLDDMGRSIEKTFR